MRYVGVVLAACAYMSGPLLAQQALAPQIASPILTIDSERLFENSQYGRKTIEEFEARGAELAAENRRIEEELVIEERELTDLRATMEPADFRVLADAFDDKVQETRRTQDGKTRELNAGLDERRVIFLNTALPVLEQLMRETGAAVVLERRSIFISSNAVDITSEAVQRLDMVLSDPEVAPEQ